MFAETIATVLSSRGVKIAAPVKMKPGEPFWTGKGLKQFHVDISAEAAKDSVLFRAQALAHAIANHGRHVQFWELALPADSDATLEEHEGVLARKMTDRSIDDHAIERIDVLFKPLA
jgi:hypothetical protein